MKSTLARLLPAIAITAALAAQPHNCSTYGALHKLDVERPRHRQQDRELGDPPRLWIIPVYELAILGDFLIFNTIEFATGSNPLN